ncbi:sterol desaturase family protein [Fontimonas sp. SYSU GA230001]|uniref:sterol desaturase family protein n=1 Tax=Fontimonas sp. SYSU GA230001 TaxID=3142450 RepID=UPI0032B3416F
MSAEDLVALMIPVTFFAMMAAEPLLKTGRTFPEIRWWRGKGVLFFVVLMTINAVLPSLVPPEWAAHSLLPGARLGVAGGALAGYVVLSLATATLHRAYHRYPLLWRVHQLHHAPQRIDIAGAVVFTPLEVINNVIVSFTVMVFVLGLDPLAAAITGYVAAFYGLFQHFNVRTPRWLGYLIQRPESHCVHHRRGFHSYNYSDLPIWDVLWGTFRNPAEFHGEVGFEQEESLRFGAMLLGRDVNAATLGPGARGRTDAASNPA